MNGRLRKVSIVTTFEPAKICQFAKVMFLQVSVRPQGRHAWPGVACVVKVVACMAEGMCMARGMHDGVGHAWEGACMAGGMHGGGARHATPPGQTLRDTVNERVVRIPLECILVCKSKQDPMRSGADAHGKVTQTVQKIFQVSRVAGIPMEY